VRKAKDWHADFKKLLAPRLLRALQSDRSGITPLKTAQRRQIRAMLRIVMNQVQIDKAIGMQGRRRRRRAKVKARAARS
jgi:hypothetical protein